MILESLAKIYTGLAQVIPTAGSNLPDWLGAQGRYWPIFESAVQIASQQPDSQWRHAVEALAAVKPSSQGIRRSEYEALFIGQGRPPIWLYESWHVNGRIPGPATFAIQALYKQAGLKYEGAEMPDHAALELSFLSYLCRQEIENGEPEWRDVRRIFIKNHAGLWLPEVGRALICCMYPAWQALGYVLVSSLAQKSAKPRRAKTNSQNSLPTISEHADCNLCGFCVQSCPTRALGIREDERTTALLLAAERCIYCEQCVRVCLSEALTLENTAPARNLILLRESDRAVCPACNSKTVSQAELDAIATQLGEHPRWLDYCMACRPYQMEMN